VSAENSEEMMAVWGIRAVAKEIFGDIDGEPVHETLFLRLDTANVELGENSLTNLNRLLRGLRIESSSVFFRRFWATRASPMYFYSRDVEDFVELSKIIERTVGPNHKVNNFQMKTEDNNLLVYNEVVYDDSYDVQIYAAYFEICDTLEQKGYSMSLSEAKKNTGDGSSITTCIFRHPEMPGRSLTVVLNLHENNGGEPQNSILLAWRIGMKELY
jgi:hypothetical protein